jgi:hypothetical protein
MAGDLIRSVSLGSNGPPSGGRGRPCRWHRRTADESAAVPVLTAGSARAWLGRSPRRLEVIGGTGGLVMIGIGARLALTGRKD